MKELHHCRIRIVDSRIAHRVEVLDLAVIVSTTFNKDTEDISILVGLGCHHDHRQAVPVLGITVCPALDKGFGNLRVLVICYSKDQGRPAVHVFVIHLGTSLKEGLCHSRLEVSAGSGHERCGLVSVPHINISTCLDKSVENINICGALRGKKQCGVTMGVGLVDLCTVL